MGEVKDVKSVSVTDVFEIAACVVVTSNYNQLSCFMNNINPISYDLFK